MQMSSDKRHVESKTFQVGVLELARMVLVDHRTLKNKDGRSATSFRERGWAWATAEQCPQLAWVSLGAEQRPTLAWPLIRNNNLEV